MRSIKFMVVQVKCALAQQEREWGKMGLREKISIIWYVLRHPDDWNIDIFTGM